MSKVHIKWIIHRLQFTNKKRRIFLTEITQFLITWAILNTNKITQKISIHYKFFLSIFDYLNINFENRNHDNFQLFYRYSCRFYCWPFGYAYRSQESTENPGEEAEKKQLLYRVKTLPRMLHAVYQLNKIYSHGLKILAWHFSFTMPVYLPVRVKQAWPSPNTLYGDDLLTRPEITRQI